MSQVECWTCKDFLGRRSKYDMLLDKQVTEDSTRWESCRGGVDR
jgi:hypothetical protein